MGRGLLQIRRDQPATVRPHRAEWLQREAQDAATSTACTLWHWATVLHPTTSHHQEGCGNPPPPPRPTTYPAAPPPLCDNNTKVSKFGGYNTYRCSDNGVALATRGGGGDMIPHVPIRIKPTPSGD